MLTTLNSDKHVFFLQVQCFQKLKWGHITMALTTCCDLNNGWTCLKNHCRTMFGYPDMTKNHNVVSIE